MSRWISARPLPVFHFNRAIVRQPAKSVVGGLRARDGDDPSYHGVLAEHEAYTAALGAAGVSVTAVPPLEDFPDSVFVEDPALVFAEGAILLRPGAPSRVAETFEIAPTIRSMFDRVLDLPSGFADGGDVLVTPARVVIGLSARTDRAGAEALAACLAELGRKSVVVETPDYVLHLKTACSLLDDETILCAPSLAGAEMFGGLREVVTCAGEDAAANALRVNDVVLAGAGFPRTIERLDSLGYLMVPLATSQIGKLDAGLSCLSLRWRDPRLD